MSRLYGPKHREFQDLFESRTMADRVEAIAAKTEIDDVARAFIESRDMFFLASADHNGRPTVSYKGGDPGFVRVLDATTLAFPSYDGNGMHYSTGNIAGNGEIGCLFIDFERPFRLRLQGKAQVLKEGPLMGLFKEAELVVKVAVSDVWMNCPRYIHRYKKLSASRYVPRADTETPLCEWKRIDGMQDTLRPHETAAVERAGHITIDEWMGRVMTGDEKA
ncbi:MAG: pyridoxamine 5'-phosphate oxidase family protein [Hyphomicrobium zavarzinii]|jgi:predicted pyridoxine 5'-phosphate oxidase superfamily flavin-nucleotide-binding protein|uniref:pyridoxamine 5'-phosphate oxidase family protein n=1 Tax=Hyphomicrobium TaxID=81 RepID=UPI000361B21A|nr:MULTISPECIES: pyridoxamine 5'-phosphate oxidase family protein [Hyphomicrobium]MBL8847938.1 pyridoxamine 5'-phosphate oxidase family protein [Hyphomicrobium zavarzinii]WBT39081.1 pyridoxamine 5'-phosphate oxidase family protein [Hyphomicrobium sp. DMF-1]HML44324.1 pyridoxamine 5'-phosphate oxidase family protein [Hyphomicrobium zavarzinii]